MANATFAPVAAQGRAPSDLELSVVEALRAGGPYSGDSHTRLGQMRVALEAAGFTLGRARTPFGRRKLGHRRPVTLVGRDRDGAVFAIEDGRMAAKLKSLQKLLDARRMEVVFGDGYGAIPTALMLVLLGDVEPVVTQGVVVFGIPRAE